MNDMRKVIIPKSDQINADNLLGGPMTITITEVTIRPGTEQPVSIHFEGDGGKPFKPCKSMCKVMVTCWGPDANEYIGRSMTLYNDPKVKWGGMAVGGIRISHMTGLDGARTMALTETKGSKKLFTVLPLAEIERAEPTFLECADEALSENDPKKWLAALLGLLAECPTIDDMAALKGFGSVKGVEKNAPPHVRSIVMKAFTDASLRLGQTDAPADPIEGEVVA